MDEIEPRACPFCGQTEKMTAHGTCSPCASQGHSYRMMTHAELEVSVSRHREYPAVVTRLRKIARRLQSHSAAGGR